MQGNGRREQQPRRVSREARREQIIDATLDLVAEHGVAGTTLVRIAERVGVTTPALYIHFPNRKEILLAALDVLFEHRTLPRRAPREGTAAERIRAIERHHSEVLASENDHSVIVLFEFIAAAPDEGLRETLGQKQMELLRDVAEIIRQGQAEGNIRADANASEVAWMIVCRAWARDIAHVTGITGEWQADLSGRMLDLILDSVAVRPSQDPPRVPARAERSRPACLPAPTTPRKKYPLRGRTRRRA